MCLSLLEDFHATITASAEKREHSPFSFCYDGLSVDLSSLSLAPTHRETPDDDDCQTLDDDDRRSFLLQPGRTRVRNSSSSTSWPTWSLYRNATSDQGLLPDDLHRSNPRKKKVNNGMATNPVRSRWNPVPTSSGRGGGRLGGNFAPFFRGFTGHTGILSSRQAKKSETRDETRHTFRRTTERCVCNCSRSPLLCQATMETRDVVRERVRNSFSSSRFCCLAFGERMRERGESSNLLTKMLKQNFGKF